MLLPTSSSYFCLGFILAQIPLKQIPQYCSFSSMVLTSVSLCFLLVLDDSLMRSCHIIGGTKTF